ncbi:hypothetical protein M2336_002672 [Sphingobium sp. B1D7B]|uniref:DUF4143 domain-containing protein n=1 Tax=unclassified Sphingobium TaxID=2611147 RepID=UPI00222481A5|nr:MULTISPECIES: DUF4143 domain-containing protein [unclassified Sphingobium]MCW2390900.1 hypothetical protein [Sphingobium sp. B11D3A]MCW2406043.1 hypothetical protein [Sphingobium sp. B1D7B]
MTGRLALQAQLDAAVEQRTMTLVQGLPRVGRSQLIADWMQRRTDAVMCSDSAVALGTDGVLVLDHLDLAGVRALVVSVRAAGLAGARTRYVAAPADLATSFALRDTLAGGFDTIDVMPLRPDEIEDGFASLSAAMGPLVAAAAPAMPGPQLVLDRHRHWLRGGFPESLNAPSDQASLAWRRQLLGPLLERDYGRCGLPPAYPLQDVLRWLAQRNSAEVDEAINKFGKRSELKSAIFTLDKLGLIRRLPNVAAVEHPDELVDKVFVRDTGILHALLGIITVDQLEASKAIGASFESYAIEALIAAAGRESGAHFYRFDNGQGFDEIDLILDFPAQAGRRIAIEFKVGPTKRAEPGFFRACALLGIDEQFVVHSGPESYCEERVHRLDLRSAMRRVAAVGAKR